MWSLKQKILVVLQVTCLSILVLSFSFAPEIYRTTAGLPSYKNWGLTNSSFNSHIQAVDAWKIEEGSRDVVVAVVDTGIDSKHKDLEKNIWKNPKTYPKGKIEFGWNFVNNTPNPKDEHGHGTHVSGIIGAVANPRTGVSGVAHRVSIMAVKYYSDTNSGAVNLKNTIKALHYAIDHGARIINYSGGGPEYSHEEYLAIKKAAENGIIFICAAGNEHQNVDQKSNAYFPASYHLGNMISVAATDIHNNLLSSSNWGKNTIDVAAPGENIYSTLNEGRYGYMSGTSQATAFVTGLAALLLAHNPSLTPYQVKKIIMNSVDHFSQLNDKITTSGRVNAYLALMQLKKKDWIHEPSSLVAKKPISLYMGLDKGLDKFLETPEKQW